MIEEMYFLLVCVHPDVDIFSIQFSNSVFIPLRIQLLQRLTMEGSFVLHVLQNRHMHLGMNSSHDAFQAHSRYRALVGQFSPMSSSAGVTIVLD